MQVMYVRLHKSGKIHLLANPDAFDLDDVVVLTANNCEEIGIVIQTADVAQDAVALSRLQFSRLANEKDLAHRHANQVAADEALNTAKELVNKAEMPMKMIASRYTLDRRKLLFYFTADNRVDFRVLVRELAAIFKTRIELRQIGVRDEAKILGGIGPCGRQLCCTSFLGDFGPVSIKMAKNQKLSLNPAKISGICGRLMCCLSYEDQQYEVAKKAMPDYGGRVITEDGGGRIVGMNLLEHVLQVKLDGHEVPINYDLDEIKVPHKER
ncbi:PSP1 domain-containing protein [Loigolactobacillus bifermentans]|uniref:PSP1 C-terminal domain-containing protein n=1 Tax=Loigolactobacillus bifermentans DSM 20003 TaxID=1423726 RepID=A0A0R1H645_9LACO|nr:stage 0 sporulation family protein [Loigolactobacillus bifermentans]KRK40051.1 hypothetical protein FC07_GL001759 [Loigolactobacillus bifermentans DSM 20003]QGG61657.1 signal peptidase [Loigolactobacillus bifermentans]